MGVESEEEELQVDLAIVDNMEGMVVAIELLEVLETIEQAHMGLKTRVTLLMEVILDQGNLELILQVVPDLFLAICVQKENQFHV